LILAHDLEIPTEDQTSVTELLDDKLAKHSLEPAQPGQFLDLNHLDKGLQADLVSLCQKYNLAWSTSKFDMFFGGDSKQTFQHSLKVPI
jgi:hypothetical protein